MIFAGPHANNGAEVAMYRIALNVAIPFYRREVVRTRHVLPADERFLDAITESGNQPEELRFCTS